MIRLVKGRKYLLAELAGIYINYKKVEKKNNTISSVYRETSVVCR